MEMAISQSLLSIGEHLNKPDPLVGAILATREGKVLAKSYRGELRIGEHCEFTLIERKLKDKNLKDCVLYVTLEPCIDLVRKKPKRGCATHIRKSRIGKVYIGMRDPDIDIGNYGVNELIEAGIEVVDFPADLSMLIRESLKDFIEFKENENFDKVKIRKEKLLPYLKQVSLNSSIEQFSTNVVRQFILNSNADFQYPSFDFNDWAIRFGLAILEKKKIVPTKMGLLLFGEKVDEVYPHSIFKVEIDYGGKSEIKDFGGPVSTQLPRVLDFIKNKALKLTIDRTNAKRTNNINFPFEILREVIANAIIHRDYSIETSTNYIYISAEKIVVKSPGLPVIPLTIEDIKTMDLPSISRNPKIMYIYNRMGMAEQRGIGLRNLKELPSLGFPLPIFKLIGNIIEITLIRDKNKIDKIFGFEDLNLTDKEKEGLAFIQNNGPVSVLEYAEFLKLEKKTAQRRLLDFVNKGIVKTEGENRWTKYSIMK